MFPGKRYEEWVALTREALANPKVGDRFQEQYSYWVYVVGRDGDRVTTLSASAPCTFPNDGKPWEGTISEFAAKHTNSAGPWVLYTRNIERDYSPWLAMAKRGLEEYGRQVEELCARISSKIPQEPESET